MKLETPRAASEWKSKGSKAVFELFYEYLYQPPLANGDAPNLTPTSIDSYFDAWAPTSWNLTLTLNSAAVGGDC